jgi:hypothetical protein
MLQLISLTGILLDGDCFDDLLFFADEEVKQKDCVPGFSRLM